MFQIKLPNYFLSFMYSAKPIFFSIWHLILELGHTFKQEFEVTLC